MLYERKEVGVVLSEIVQRLSNCDFQRVRNSSFSRGIGQYINAIVAGLWQISRPVFRALSQRIAQPGSVKIKTDATARGQMKCHSLAAPGFQQIVVTNSAVNRSTLDGCRAAMRKLDTRDNARSFLGDNDANKSHYGQDGNECGSFVLQDGSHQ